jgi:hypothetical protein
MVCPAFQSLLHEENDDGGSAAHSGTARRRLAEPHPDRNNSLNSASSRWAEGASPTTPANRPQGTVVQKRQPHGCDDEGGWCRLPFKDAEPQRELMPFFLERLLEGTERLSRRTFLKSVSATLAWLTLPRLLTSWNNARSFWFLHTETGQSWAVDDPVVWCLENARQPILERTRDRLVTLDASDPQRIIRLVTRRYRLNLIKVQGSLVVRHSLIFG